MSEHADEDARALLWEHEKRAREYAHGWGASVRRLSQKERLWCSALRAARSAGILPGVLRPQIEEAAHKAGVPLSALPAAVWQAADLEPPQQ